MPRIKVIPSPATSLGDILSLGFGGQHLSVQVHDCDLMDAVAKVGAFAGIGNVTISDVRTSWGISGKVGSIDVTLFCPKRDSDLTAAEVMANEG